MPLLLLSADSSPALVLLGTGIVGCGLGAAFPPATAVIMNDLGTEKAGDGAAVNQVARQVGGALGVAIVGSVFGAIYAAEIADDERVPAAATESIEQATDVGEPPERRGPCRPPERRRRELRRGGPLGPCRLHGGPPPRGGQRGHRPVTGAAGQAMIRAAR